MTEVVSCEPLRTAVGRRPLWGTLHDVIAAELGVTVLTSLVKWTGLRCEQIDEVVLGQCYPSGEVPCIGRFVALDTDLPVEEPGVQLVVPEPGPRHWGCRGRLLEGEVVLVGRLRGALTPVNELLQRTVMAMAPDGRAPGSVPETDLLADLADVAVSRREGVGYTQTRGGSQRGRGKGAFGDPAKVAGPESAADGGGN